VSVEQRYVRVGCTCRSLVGWSQFTLWKIVTLVSTAVSRTYGSPAPTTQQSHWRPATLVSLCPLSVCLSLCLFVCLSVSLSLRLSVCSSVCLPVCPSVRLPACLSVRLFVCLPACLSVCLSVSRLCVSYVILLCHKCKCIGDDTKATARQSPNYIKKTKNINYGKKDFQYGGWNSFTLQWVTLSFVNTEV